MIGRQARLRLGPSTGCSRYRVTPPHFNQRLVGRNRATRPSPNRCSRSVMPGGTEVAGPTANRASVFLRSTELICSADAVAMTHRSRCDVAARQSAHDRRRADHLFFSDQVKSPRRQASKEGQIPRSAGLYRAPLRNRTVDLLLTMDHQQVPITAAEALNWPFAGSCELSQAAASAR
jgi:hypothetical protein